MLNNIVNYFEKTVAKNYNKVAIVDESSSLTFGELKDKAKKIASSIFESLNGEKHKNIALFIDRSCDLTAAMMGAVYSGNVYTVLDTHSPKDRLDKILDVLNPSAVIVSKDTKDNFCQNFGAKNVICVGDCVEAKNSANLDDIISTDPLYILFTSGSTGVPKGTVLSHGNVISYIEWFIDTFRISNKTVFGSQTPLYFSMSVSDFFATIFAGATYVIIPTKYFAFPLKAIQFMNEQKVNTIYWVPSAISIMANIDMFKYQKPEYLKKVLFAGEVMHNKPLNYWRNNLKGVKYYNLFGPTEATDICCYYEVNRKFRNDESLPIGIACRNCDCMIVSDGKRVTAQDEMGELYIRGSFLAHGYYKNDAKNKENFVQNPIQNDYPEVVYKTGDLVKYNKYGEMEFCGRADYQIKHMGYRIELGEIENTIVAIEKVQDAVCLFDDKNDEIVLIYTGRIKVDELMATLNKKLVYYMMPAKVYKEQLLPYNANGKVDRKALKNTYIK